VRTWSIASCIDRVTIAVVDAQAFAAVAVQGLIDAAHTVERVSRPVRRGVRDGADEAVSPDGDYGHAEPRLCGGLGCDTECCKRTDVRDGAEELAEREAEEECSESYDDDSATLGCCVNCLKPVWWDSEWEKWYHTYDNSPACAYADDNSKRIAITPGMHTATDRFCVYTSANGIDTAAICGVCRPVRDIVEQMIEERFGPQTVEPLAEWEWDVLGMYTKTDPRNCGYCGQPNRGVHKSDCKRPQACDATIQGCICVAPEHVNGWHTCEHGASWPVKTSPVASATSDSGEVVSAHVPRCAPTSPCSDPSPTSQSGSGPSLGGEGAAADSGIPQSPAAARPPWSDLADALVEHKPSAEDESESEPGRKELHELIDDALCRHVMSIGSGTFDCSCREKFYELGHWSGHLAGHLADLILVNAPHRVYIKTGPLGEPVPVELRPDEGLSANQQAKRDAEIIDRHFPDSSELSYIKCGCRYECDRVSTWARHVADELHPQQ
jgi:hypothetical protein